MDWLIYIMMIILFAAVLVLLWKNYRIKKEAKLFAEKVEDALDAIVTGKEWNMEEELEDSLWGRTGTQLAKAGNVFRKKEEDGFREKERVKGLISDISHQTRTPIANIKLYLELLEDEEFSQNGQEFLGKIKGQMEKIEFLMQNMIKMSRLETGILQIHKEDQNLYETIRHAVADVVPEAALKGINLYLNRCAKIFHEEKILLLSKIHTFDKSILLCFCHYFLLKIHKVTTGSCLRKLPSRLIIEFFRDIKLFLGSISVPEPTDSKSPCKDSLMCSIRHSKGIAYIKIFVTTFF